jgi:hypothetical protein
VAQVRELQRRVDGAALRVARAQQQLDEFQRERARDLLAEREQPARTIAADLTASVQETLRLAKAYVAERRATGPAGRSCAGGQPTCGRSRFRTPMGAPAERFGTRRGGSTRVPTAAASLARTGGPQSSGQQRPPPAASAPQEAERRRANAAGYGAAQTT